MYEDIERIALSSLPFWKKESLKMQSPESNRLSLLATSDTTSNTNSYRPRKRPKSLIINIENARKKKSGCNCLEKFLILIISMMLIFCVVLLCLYLKERELNARLSSEVQKTSRNKTAPNSSSRTLSRASICWTKECIQTATELFSSINPKVNPCDDFYEYACGGWVEKNPSDHPQWNQFTKLTKENNDLMKRLINSKEVRAFYSKDDAITKALLYYDSCMNKAEIERLEGEPLKELLRKYGGWPVLDKSWNASNWNFLKHFVLAHRELDASPFVQVFVDLDLKNSSVNVINIDQSFVGTLSPRAFLVNSTMYETMRQAYRELMMNLSRVLGGDEESEKDMIELFEFERELSKIVTPNSMKPNMDVRYKKMTIRQLQNITGNEIKWMDFLQGVFNKSHDEINEDREVVVYDLQYLIKLNEFIAKASKRLLSNYFLWRVVKTHYVQLSKDYTNIYKNYFIRSFKFFPKVTRQEKCIERLYDNFGMPISRLYLDRRFNGKSKIMAREIIDNIKRAFIENVLENNWMENSSKQAAIDKAKALLENIGYPDSIMNRDFLSSLYQKVHVDPKKYFMNEVQIKMSTNIKNLEKLDKPVDKTEWPFPPTMLNAYYSYSENKMVFPAGVLQSPFYDSKYIRAINYGAIGSIMAHELTHGFDDRGKLYDRNGNLVQWWTKKTLDNFHNKSHCLIEQYGNFTFYGSPVNGLNTLSENIADNGGIKQAYKAYKSWVREHGEEPRLPGMMLSNDQVLFLGFARNWCQRQDELTAKLTLRFDTHAPGAWRVNGSLRNFPAFSRTFNCPLGSPMNPVKKCSVW